MRTTGMNFEELLMCLDESVYGPNVAEGSVNAALQS